MSRNIFVSEKIGRVFVLFIVFALFFTAVAKGQKAKCKKWTYDFSEVVKYFDTPQEACKAYVKEKYPNDNYKAVVEATKDAETFRCSADDTYMGVVYKRECDSCCSKPQALQTRPGSYVPIVKNPLRESYFFIWRIDHD